MKIIDKNDKKINSLENTCINSEKKSIKENITINDKVKYKNNKYRLKNSNILNKKFIS